MGQSQLYHHYEEIRGRGFGGNVNCVSSYHKYTYGDDGVQLILLGDAPPPNVFQKGLLDRFIKRQPYGKLPPLVFQFFCQISNDRPFY